MNLFNIGSTFLDNRWEFLALEKSRLESLFLRAKNLPEKQNNNLQILWAGEHVNDSSESISVNYFLNSDKSNKEKYEDLKNYLLESKKYTEVAGTSGTKVSKTNNNPKGNEIYYRGNLEKDKKGNFVKNGFGISMGDNKVINIRTLKAEENGNYRIEGEIIQLFPNGIIVKGQPLVRKYEGKSSKSVRGKQQRNIKNENLEIDFSKDVVISKKEYQQFIGKVNAKIKEGNKTPIRIKELNGTVIESIDGYHFECEYPPASNGILKGKVITPYGVKSFGSFNEHYSLEGYGVKCFGDSRNQQCLDYWEIKGNWANGQPIDKEEYKINLAGKEFKAHYQEKEKRFFIAKANIQDSENYLYKGELEIPLNLKAKNEELRFNEYFQDLELKPLNGKLKFSSEEITGSAIFEYKNGNLDNRYKINAGTRSLTEAFAKDSTAKSMLLDLDLKKPINERLGQPIKSRLRLVNKSNDFKLYHLAKMNQKLEDEPFTSFAEIRKILEKEVKDILHLVKNTKKDFRENNNGFIKINLNNGYFVREYPNNYYEYVDENNSAIELAFELGEDRRILKLSKLNIDDEGLRSSLIYRKRNQAVGLLDDKIFISQGFMEKDKKIPGCLITEAKDRLEGSFDRAFLEGEFVINGKFKRYQQNKDSTNVKYKNGVFIKEVNPTAKKEKRIAKIKNIASNALGWNVKDNIPGFIILMMTLAAIYEGMGDSNSVTALDDFSVSISGQAEIIEAFEGLNDSDRELTIANILLLFKLDPEDKSLYDDAFDRMAGYSKKERAYHNFSVLSKMKDEKFNPPIKLKLRDGLLIPYKTTVDDSELQYTNRLMKRMRNAYRRPRDIWEFPNKKFNPTNDPVYKKFKAQYEAYQKKQKE